MSDQVRALLILGALGVSFAAGVLVVVEVVLNRGVPRGRAPWLSAVALGLLGLGTVLLGAAMWPSWVELWRAATS